MARKITKSGPCFNKAVRIKSALGAASAFIISAYVLYTLEANKLTGVYRLVSVIPLFFAFVYASKAACGFCSMANRMGKASLNIYWLSLVSAAAVAIAAVLV